MEKDEKIKKSNTFSYFLVILIILILIWPNLKLALRREITINNNSEASVISLGKVGSILPVPLRKDRVNFLFLGVAGEGNSAPQLTDTILIINSSPKGDNPVGVSIPRDLLIKYPNANYYTKINALYQEGGIKTIAKKIFEITNLEIDYYLVLDLNSVKDLINKLDGIDIEVKEDIYDPKFPAEYNSFEIFSLAKGDQHLNGETALKYIRTRNQPMGDFSRIERQQQVISAIKDKILDLSFIWDFPKILSLWNILQKNASTNIDLIDLKYAWNLIKKANVDEIKFNAIAPPLVISDTTILGNETASVLVPKVGTNNYTEIQAFINKLIN